MNAFIKIVLFALLFVGLPSLSFAQEESDTTFVSYKLYVVVKNDGSEYIGQITKQDAREVLLKTKELGEIIIPKHEIKSITEAEKSGRTWKGGTAAINRMGTRYFFGSNALPLKKGDSYLKSFWLSFLDAQFAVTDNFSLGVSGTYLGVPIIVTPRMTWQVGEKIHLGLSGLFGWGGLFIPTGWGTFAYGAATLGDYDRNISLGVGYGAIGDESSILAMNTPLLTLNGCQRIGKKVWLIFESYGFAVDGEAVGIVLPGVRWQTKPTVNWEIGTGGILVSGDVFPLPMVTYSRSFSN